MGLQLYYLSKYKMRKPYLYQEINIFSWGSIPQPPDVNCPKMKIGVIYVSFYLYHVATFYFWDFIIFVFGQFTFIAYLKEYIQDYPQRMRLKRRPKNMLI